MGLEGQHPPGARMSHPDVDDPQDTSTRNQGRPGNALSLHPLVSWTGQARKIQMKVLILMVTKVLNTTSYSVSLQFGFFFPKRSQFLPNLINRMVLCVMTFSLCWWATRISTA